MITEHDLKEAIAECQGRKNPNTTTCLQLAAFYTIKDHLYPDKIEVEQPSYSYANEPHNGTITYYSETEFGQMIEGMDEKELLSIMDELMSAIQVLNPSLYKSVMRKL